jgi:RimJ/RimL family protein N-acetyltransferase
VPTLQAFAPSHLDLLRGWLAQPRVARWYPDPTNDLAFAATPPARGAQAIIAEDGQPVGYLRWTKVARDTLDALGLHEIPTGSVDIDILLGERSTIGRGIGPAALQLLVEQLRCDPGVPLLGLTTSVENASAHRAFAKAGFHIARQYDAGAIGLCHLMIRDLRR